MTLTNKQIYLYAEKLNKFSLADIKIPVRINFFLQRNITVILELAQEVENLRMKIAQSYGTPAENGYEIPTEHRAMVNEELNALFAIQQEVDIHMFTLCELENLDLTWDQLSAICFMIREDDVYEEVSE